MKKEEMRMRSDLPIYLVEQGYKVGAEIGVYKGGFTEKFCQAGLKMYAIDPWMAYSGAGRPSKLQERQDYIYEEEAKKRLAPYDCTLIRATSMDALKEFKDGSLDFVYIDGDHTFRYIAEDLFEWSKKVRSGGVVSGHDYYYFGPSKGTGLWCQVGPVVDAYVKAFEITTLHTFGRNRKSPDKDDRYLSWMFTKV